MIRKNMAAIINTMDRVVSNSRRQNQIIQILIKSFLAGIAGYSIFILTLIVSFRIISGFFNLGSSQLGSTVLIISSLGYLTLYTIILIREMKNKNFCK
jgi:hypothetical protein